MPEREVVELRELGTAGGGVAAAYAKGRHMIS